MNKLQWSITNKNCLKIWADHRQMYKLLFCSRDINIQWN